MQKTRIPRVLYWFAPARRLRLFRQLENEEQNGNIPIIIAVLFTQVSDFRCCWRRYVNRYQRRYFIFNINLKLKGTLIRNTLFLIILLSILISVIAQLAVTSFPSDCLACLSLLLLYRYTEYSEKVFSSLPSTTVVEKFALYYYSLKFLISRNAAVHDLITEESPSAVCTWIFMFSSFSAYCSV